MNTYINKGFEYFYDKNQKLWVMYPINDNGDRIEWDSNDNPIESEYFNNKKELINFLTTKNHNNELERTTTGIQRLRKRV